MQPDVILQALTNLFLIQSFKIHSIKGRNQMAASRKMCDLEAAFRPEGVGGLMSNEHRTSGQTTINISFC